MLALTANPMQRIEGSRRDLIAVIDVPNLVYVPGVVLDPVIETAG